MAVRTGSGYVPSLPPPRPKSPPEYPDLYGKRRELAKLQMLEREICFYEEELKSVEGLPPASRCCKEVADFVIANADPLIPTRKKLSRSRRFWKWICGMSCFSLTWICCCCNCSPPQNCCCNCSPPQNCCCNCSPPQNCCCNCSPQNCCKCDICSSSCGNPCANFQVPKYHCTPCNICCSPCWNNSQCFSKCKCSCNCCCSIPECPSCLTCPTIKCTCLTCPTIKCTCYPIRCSKFNICSCCCSKSCCFPCYFC